jgi:hypothetical protein
MNERETEEIEMYGVLLLVESVGGKTVATVF